MKIAIAAALALSLAGCATTTGNIHVDTGKGLINAESALDGAVMAATAAVNAHVTTKAQNAAIATLIAPCPSGVVITTAVAAGSCPVVGFLALARQAYAASDTASFAVLEANLLSLATQLATTHP